MAAGDGVELDFAKGGGLIPAIIQDAETGEVLTLFYMDEEALRRTRESREVWRYSRSEGRMMRKGDTSGNVLHVESIAADCDGDALVVRVHPVGPACHTGQRTCFHNPLDLG
ncbi:MAG: phosphoribosyl-AMP cyclohydrolase [Chloroflexi bacterium RBG_16_68_14]|nr:MAG: phosphoribosyl-AMP cyclohydrolase [Chloroflexi bacterium RBG_16_68_14]